MFSGEFTGIIFDQGLSFSRTPRITYNGPRIAYNTMILCLEHGYGTNLCVFSGTGNITLDLDKAEIFGSFFFARIPFTAAHEVKQILLMRMLISVPRI